VCGGITWLLGVLPVQLRECAAAAGLLSMRRSVQQPAIFQETVCQAGEGKPSESFIWLCASVWCIVATSSLPSVR
jgi:hypothetical protein